MQSAEVSTDMTFRKAFFAVGIIWALLLFSLQAGAADNVLRATLPNGLRVVIVPNDLAPVVTTQVIYLVGAIDAPDGFPGMAHAEEHMMFRGHPGLSSAQFSAIDAALGGDANAGTSQVSTGYHLTIPSDALEVALHIESIRMRGVLDRQEDWVKERGAMEQEIARDLSDPGYSFYIRLLAEDVDLARVETFKSMWNFHSRTLSLDWKRKSR